MRRSGAASLRRVCLLMVPVCLIVSAPAASPQQRTATPASSQHGAELFTGRTAFQNGGPPCGSCHSFASLPFPNGGVIGPDLSGVSSMLGPEGIDIALQTLFFPTMMPLYQNRPLTPPEQASLKALFQQSTPAAAGTAPPTGRDTLMLAALAVGGLVVLIAVAWLVWRGRLRGVRAPLVRSAAGGGARP